MGHLRRLQSLINNKTTKTLNAQTLVVKK